MYVLSIFLPISPPRASISLTTTPFAGPPTEGLHGMNATMSRLIVSNNVLEPILAAANAASEPACPAPTTMTS